MITTFTEVNDKVLQPLLSEAVVGADDLLPMSIYVTVKARCALYRVGVVTMSVLQCSTTWSYFTLFVWLCIWSSWRGWRLHCNKLWGGCASCYHSNAVYPQVIYHYIVEEGKRLLQQHVWFVYNNYIDFYYSYSFLFCTCKHGMGEAIM